MEFGRNYKNIKNMFHASFKYLDMEFCQIQ